MECFNWWTPSGAGVAELRQHQTGASSDEPRGRP